MEERRLSTSEVLERTRSYVRENFLYMRPDFELRDDQSLMKNGLVDSMGVAEVLAFLQEEFAVVIEDDEITENNLGSLSKIAQFVLSKRQNGAAA
jgi:acyl carrier protein